MYKTTDCVNKVMNHVNPAKRFYLIHFVFSLFVLIFCCHIFLWVCLIGLAPRSMFNILCTFVHLFTPLYIFYLFILGTQIKSTIKSQEDPCLYINNC